MKKRIRTAVISTILLFTVAGCEPPTPAQPQAFNVSIKDGRGTAEAWGISIDVAETTSETVLGKEEGTSSSNPEETDLRRTITLSDVTIVLRKRSVDPITLKINGKPFGELQIGDKVTIDKDRNIKVNDVARKQSDK